MPISCHFRDCKALLVTSLTRVSGAIASVQTFYLYVVEGARASIKYDKSGIQSQKLGGVASVWKWVPGTAPPQSMTIFRAYLDYVVSVVASTNT